jgi:MazG family protein
MNDESIKEEFQRLVDIIAALRNPNGGCPWDLEQTHTSLIPYLIEESYEVVDSIESQDGQLAEELGDVLLQVMLHSQIALDAGEFSIATVIKTLNEKLIRRHPHVFGDTNAETVQKVLANWEVIKAEEKKSKSTEKKGLLSGLPKALPALQRAHRIGEKVARVGFDWDSSEEVFDKVLEELEELKVEIASKKAQSAALREELGDLLFSLAQFSRLLGFNAEEVLREANGKFQNRFEKVEALSEVPLSERRRDELEALWQEVKAAEVK